MDFCGLWNPMYIRKIELVVTCLKSNRSEITFMVVKLQNTEAELVIRLFVYRNYGKSLMETEMVSNNI